MGLNQLLSTLQSLGVELATEGDQLRVAAPPGVMTPELRGQLRTYKPEIIEFLKRVHNQETQTFITPTPRNAPLLLSYAQQRLWFLAKLGDDATYNMPLVLEIEGQLVVAILQQTLSEIVRRHESLRTGFVMQADAPYQLIQPPLAVALPVIDLRDMAGDAQRNQVKRLSEDEAQRPFDLTHDLMLRAQVLQLAEERFVVLLTIHHIAADGWSVRVLLRELVALYTSYTQGQPSPLPELPIQYADFAAWQRAYLQGAVLERQLRWWKEHLADAPDLLQLPSDRPRPAQQSFRGGAVSLQIEAGLTQQLRQLSHAQGGTLYMTLLAAFQLLLHRYTGQAQIVVGSPIANRNDQALEGLIGFLVNTLALCSDLTGNPTFLDLLAQVQQTTQAAYEHQDLPFERLVEELRPERNLTYNPLVQVVFVLQNMPTGAFMLPGLRVTPAMIEVKTTRSDLELHLWETDDHLDGVCIYATDLFDATTIARLIDNFQSLLRGIADNPGQPIQSLPLLTPNERHQLLVEWAAGDASGEPGEPHYFHHLFETQAVRRPNAVAAIMAGAGVKNQLLTYAELNARANQLAHHLQSLDGAEIRAETVVGICVERSLAMVVGLLGIFKAGGAYLPLDPTYPPDRFAFMLQDAAPRVIVTQAKYRALFPPTVQLICLDSDGGLIATQPVHNPCTAVTADHLAYLIYTSGSTGQAKGVLLAHGGLYNLARAQIDAFGIQPGHRVLQVASLNFDASISEIVMTLGAGATLVLAPADELLPGPPLAQTLQQQAITHVTLVPTALTLLEPETLPQLATVIAVGEACPAALGERWAQGRHFFNAYGPTEITVCATIMDGDQWHHRQQSPPIGRPMANTQVYLLDQCHQPVPIGVAGEIYIGGVGVARGYLNRPELTMEKFMPNPFGAGRLYKTGDLARWLADGNLEFLGRIDQQVKLRGFRIELGEIEAVLNQHPAVQEAVVIAHTGTPEAGGPGTRLIAYIVAEETRRQGDRETGGVDPAISPTLPISLSPCLPISPSDLRSYLQTKLPDYMVPSAFMVLEALPLTPNGKVDRHALPAPVESNLASAQAYVAPRTATEVQLAAIWSAVLAIEQVGIHDNFFERGGHSLLTVQLMQRIQTHFATAIPLQRLFAEPTIAGLAAQIDAERLAAEQLASAMPLTSAPATGMRSSSVLPGDHPASHSCLVPLRTSGTRPPFFCVHPLAGVVFPYYELAYHLGAEQPVYGLQAVGLAGKEAPLQNLAAMAAHYLRALQTVQPVGPYYVGGWSLGGLIAHVMAQQLEAVGETVACLAIIDTPAPSSQLPNTLGAALRFGIKTLAPALGAYVTDYWKLWRQRQLDLQLPAPYRLLRVTLANAQAGRYYKMQPYAGRVTLLRSTQDFGPLGQGPDLGWRDFARGGVDVVPVPGDHMTLLRPPHVSLVAEQLTASLAKARQQAML
ncbi:MAG: amino acid adenylation domain-containing protein [Chloroflexi bacterium]|nr:amino acid adenylation domain-containing protein [Chloroflexota bacterium]